MHASPFCERRINITSGWFLRPALRLASLTALWAVIPGCAAPAAGPAGPTQADRLMQAYRELEAGRFFVLADFEGPDAEKLVALVNASGKGGMKVDARRGKPETGGTALEFKSASGEDALVLAGSDDSSGYFKRDWRPYDELMISVYSPSTGVRLQVGLGGGAASERHSVFTEIPLERGWNTARVDLAELEGRIPLDDMRELRLAVLGSRKAIAVRFDDMLLTRSREDLLGDSANTLGGMYVQRIASHWSVGAGGQFELTFMNGQVTKWYNLKADPHRIRNLVEGTTLGPTPVTVNPTTGEYLPVISAGAAVRVDQRLIEMTPVRVVVGVDWFASSVDPGAKPGPLVAFRYVIYPTGQTYSEATVAPSVSRADAPRGLLVSLAAPTEADVEVTTPSVSSMVGPSASFFAVQHKPGSAVLAFIPANPEFRLLHTYDPSTRQVALIAVDDSSPSGQACISHLYLGASDDAWEQSLTQRAADYLAPARLSVSIGSTMDDKSPIRRADGFDKAAGCYRAAPENGRLRLTLDGSERPLFSPAFCVEDSGGRPGWVYLKHLIHQPVAADAAGNLVFQLPSEIRDRRLVEVVLEPSAHTSLP